MNVKTRLREQNQKKSAFDNKEKNLSSFMKSLLFLLVLIAVIAVKIFATEDKIIEILEYGDEFCTGGVLVTSQATAGKCYSGEYASGSGIMTCIDTENSNSSSSSYRCLQLHEFSNERCSQRTAIRERVCSTCLGDKTGKHSEFICNDQQHDEILMRSNCNGDFSTNRTVCSNCTTNTVIPLRKCTRISSDRFALVTEVVNCKKGVVNIQDFSDSTDCSRTAPMSEFLMPNDACEGGVKYICKP
jgi:hypothetical protein